MNTQQELMDALIRVRIASQLLCHAVGTDRKSYTDNKHYAAVMDAANRCMEEVSSTQKIIDRQPLTITED